MQKSILFLIIILHIIHTLSTDDDEDYYKLLGVPRDANTKEIRKAFKQLAVKLHPDKNKAVDADKIFLKITRAYEVLKDPETRKRYDLHGKSAFESYRYEYQSYTYYQNEFGIYDDDPLIVTLSAADYELNILDADQLWFVNFYSPYCHHCHELAPTWRRLAEELEGVIRIAAVNCDDDHTLCHRLSVTSYPTLILYEKEAHLHEGIRYRGTRTLEALEEFVLSKVTVDIKNITSFDIWQQINDLKWLLFLCPEDNINCPSEKTRLKLAATFGGLLNVGVIQDNYLADKISSQYKTNPIVLFEGYNRDEIGEGIDKIFNIEGSDTKELVESILKLLPAPVELDDQKFQEIRSKLRSHSEEAWLICFYMGPATELNLQLKRLPSLLHNVNIGLVHCGKNSGLCNVLHVPRYPAWGILKDGGAFELHHGRDVLYEIVSFAKESAKATNLHALSPADFRNIVDNGATWFIDWYAPWCPPCRKFMPELRKASQHFDPSKIQFGTVDCTLHRSLCHTEGIRSYPTTKIYNGSQIHYFTGVLNEGSVVEFINDVFNPLVISLNRDTFHLLENKPKDEIWVVDYFASWCQPCQKLAYQWRKLAKQVSQLKEIKIAQIDCVTNSDICSSQNVHSYPTIRLYPLGSKGLNTVAMYNGARDAVSLKRWILGFLPSPVMSLKADEFRKEILDNKNFDLPWLIDFYAPWCGHCVHFEPDFRQVAQILDGTVKSGKVDCEAERHFCARLYVNQYPTLRLYFSSNEKYEIPIWDVADIVNEVKSVISRRKHRHDEL